MDRLTRAGAVESVSKDALPSQLGSALGFRPVVGEGGWIPVPPIDVAEAEDEQSAERQAELLGYELAPDSWKPIQVVSGAVRPPIRFVDGSLYSVTAGVCKVDGGYRPLLVASLGAAELILDGTRLNRPDGGYRVMVAAAIVANRLRSRIIERLRGALQEIGVQLIALESSDFSSNFELTRRRTWDFLRHEMEGLERELILNRPDIPTLADGLLERRLTTIQSQLQPVVGMVKRNYRQYLPADLAIMLYELQPGERSPSFLIRTEHAELVSWYVKLSGGLQGPGGGLVRLAVAREYLEKSYVGQKRFRELSGISAWLRDIRCREQSYERQNVSLEPIVRVEEQLQALLPRVEQFATRVRNRLGTR